MKIKLEITLPIDDEDWEHLRNLQIMVKAYNTRIDENNNIHAQIGERIRSSYLNVLGIE